MPFRNVERQMIEIWIGDQSYLIPMSRVHRVLDLGDAVESEGRVEYDGESLRLVDGAALLGGDAGVPRGAGQGIVVRMGESSYVLRVSRVAGLHEIDPQAIEKLPPRLSTGRTGKLLDGVAAGEDRPRMVLDLTAL